MKEFAKIFKEYNFSSLNIKEHEKHVEVLNCLVALVIEKYTQSDLLRYFLPEDLSKKEDRPEYSNNLSRINYWFQLIGYWLRQLRNKPKYELSIENNQISKSIEYIKSISKQAYTSNNNIKIFKSHLAILVRKIQENAIYPNWNTINRRDFTNDQDYRQGLVDKDFNLQALESNLNQRYGEITCHEREFFAEQQRFKQQVAILQHRSDALDTKEQVHSEKENELEEKLNNLILSEKIYQERITLFNDEKKELERERKSFETETQELKEKISLLKTKKNNEKADIKYLYDSNFKLENALLDLNKAFKKQLNDPLNELLNKVLKEHGVELSLPDSQNTSEDELLTPKETESVSLPEQDVSLPSSATSEPIQALQKDNPAAATAFNIISGFFEKNPEKHENNTQVQRMNLVAKFKEEYQKFKESRPQLQRQSSQSSIDSYTSDVDSNYWDTDWEESEDEVDGDSANNIYIFSLEPTQKTKLMETIKNNLADLQTISKDRITQIVKMSVEALVPTTVKQPICKDQPNKFFSFFNFKQQQKDSSENHQTVEIPRQ